MLLSLNIENIAVIEKCNIEFCDGFNVLTGETGAGKSIIIDSINAVTGQRTSKELVRTGCDKATVSAVFIDLKKSAVDYLSELGIDATDNSVMILRTITVDGRNICKINGVNVNVGVLKEFGTKLVNIHGQHDSQALLNPDNHYLFIDNYGNYSNLLNNYKKSYNELKEIKRKIKAIQLDDDEKRRRTELLKYQINEITAAKLKSGELNELLLKRQLIRNAEKIRLSLESTLLLLSGDENTVGAESLCSEALSNINSVSKIVSLNDDIIERFSTAVSEIYEISSEIRDYNDSINFNPNELELCEQRIELINSLIKKYGADENEVIKYCENAINELNGIVSTEQEIKSLEKLCDLAEDQLIIDAQMLTNARKSASKKLADEVSDILKYLQMPDVVFKVDFQEKIYTIDGCDKIEFLISANKGQEPRPLSKIASGGELSRVMLALKSVLGNNDDVDTLIFDEIDTGISGFAADKVGRQMQKLSTNRQILCVTHLAQIAAAADNHLLIYKSSDSKNTFTNVTLLTGNERINEISRIMSGTNITENLYNSAKELIDNHLK